MWVGASPLSDSDPARVPSAPSRTQRRRTHLWTRRHSALLLLGTGIKVSDSPRQAVAHETSSAAGFAGAGRACVLASPTLRGCLSGFMALLPLRSHPHDSVWCFLHSIGVVSTEAVTKPNQFQSGPSELHPEKEFHGLFRGFLHRGQARVWPSQLQALLST